MCSLRIAFLLRWRTIGSFWSCRRIYLTYQDRLFHHPYLFFQKIHKFKKNSGVSGQLSPRHCIIQYLVILDQTSSLFRLLFCCFFMIVIQYILICWFHEQWSQFKNCSSCNITIHSFRYIFHKRLGVCMAEGLYLLFCLYNPSFFEVDDTFSGTSLYDSPSSILSIVEYVRNHFNTGTIAPRHHSEEKSDQCYFLCVQE